ncbi:FecR family protein [Agrobacterium leguminum]|uniref:FecR family protein n=1 Tax=Agrobacterium leguminum TaxID=2792015 RepID=UPI003CE59C31
MDRSVGQREDREQIEAEAAKWVIRFGGDPLSDDEHRAFEHWRLRHVQHAEAFEFAQQTWSDLANLRSAPGCLTDDIVPKSIRRGGATARFISSRRGRRLGFGVAAPTIFLAAVVGFAGFWFGNPIIMMSADYRTAPGEWRTVILSDGSAIDLASGSAVSLHFNEKERRVALLGGAAYFTVAPMVGDERRPFVVQGGNGTATALGTQFFVDRLPDAVEVAVAEHDVRVDLTGTEAQSRDVILSAGQSVRYSQQTGLGEVREKNVELASAWRRGRLVFDQVPLSDVVAELNRYRRGRIVIADSALASRTVSGVFDIKDLDRALATITRELRIKSASIPPLVTLLY